jgi:hypothetical protein
VDSGGEIFRGTADLFAEVHGARKVRLLGIYASHFGTGSTQLGLFAEQTTPAPADRLRDEVVRRFGDGTLTRASLLGRRERRNPSDNPAR